MELSSLKAYINPFFDTRSDKLFIRFDERRKCLNNAFWAVYNALKNGRKIVMLVNRDEELEYLNYFFSRYKIQSLALILNEETDFVSWYTLEKIKTHKRSQTDVRPSRQLKGELEELVQVLESRVANMYHERIGKLNLMQAYKHAQTMDEFNAETDLFSMVGQGGYKQKKTILEKASQLYKPEFKYNTNFSIFRKEIFREHLPESVLVMLKDIASEIEICSLEMQEFERSVSRKAEAIAMEAMSSLNKKFMELEKMMRRSQGHSDREKMQFILKDLWKKLKLEKTPSGNIHEDKEFLKLAMTSRIEDSVAAQKAMLGKTLYRLTPHNSLQEMGAIFEKASAVLERLEESKIFEGYSKPFFSSYGHLRDLVKEASQLVDQAIYYLGYEQEQLDWYIFLKNLEQEDYEFVQAFTELQTDWLSSFESAYLSGFLRKELAKINSISALHQDIIDAFNRYESLAHKEIYKNYKQSVDQEKYLRIEEQAKTGLSWQEFLGNHAQWLSDLFPVLIVRGPFYEEHRASLSRIADTLLTVNYIPRDEPQAAEDIRVLLSAYRGESHSKGVEQIKSWKNFQTLNCEGIEFNVNRSAHFLSTTELHKLAHYLADNIELYNNKYRIFQMRNVSILSFLGDENNVELLDKLGEKSMKEIFSTDERKNLLSALFSDRERKLLILLEDELINPYTPDNFLSQKLFLEELKIAGYTLMSTDNYRALSSHVDEMNHISQKILLEDKALIEARE